jgi:uncharacterized protein YaaN involved in tellurite resistance
MYKEQIRYVKLRDTLDISNKRKDEQNRIIESNKFVKFNKTLLDRPSYTAVNELEEKILHSSNSTFEYIRKMDADDLSEEGLEQLMKTLKQSESELAELEEPDAAKKIQLKELDKLDTIVRKGQTEGWMSYEVAPKWD